MELIKVYGEAAILDGTTAKHIAEFEKMAKDIKAKEDELKKAILTEMESKGIIKLETDELTISYVAATDRETFDSKKLRTDNPDLYDEYIRMSTVKPSIRIKLK